MIMNDSPEINYCLSCNLKEIIIIRVELISFDVIVILKIIQSACIRFILADRLQG
jgi:hypothetical protein